MYIDIFICIQIGPSQQKHHTIHVCLGSALGQTGQRNMKQPELSAFQMNIEVLGCVQRLVAKLCNNLPVSIKLKKKRESK